MPPQKFSQSSNTTRPADTLIKRSEQKVSKMSLISCIGGGLAFLLLFIVFIAFASNPNPVSASAPTDAPHCRVAGAIKSVEFREAYDEACLKEPYGCPTGMELQHPARYFFDVDIQSVSYVSGDTNFSRCESIYPVGGVKNISVDKDKVKAGDLFSVHTKIEGVVSSFWGSSFDSYRLVPEPLPPADPRLAARLAGRFLLQVESKGEAWWVNPDTKYRHYLGRPQEAFNLMRSQGMGISNADLQKIPIAGGENITSDAKLVNHLRGKILLQVHSRGEAWYLNPLDGKRYFLGRPHDAFQVMRKMGLGISNKDLANIGEAMMDVSLSECLPDDIQLSDVVDAEFSGYDSQSRTLDIRTTTVGQKLSQMKAGCTRDRALTDANGKRIVFYRLTGCWGNPPEDYEAIMQKQESELNALKDQYTVVTLTCNSSGIPVP